MAISIERYTNQPVAVKYMRHFLRGSGAHRQRLRFLREALVWRDLHHPFILPLLGIDNESFPLSLCLVSPWMEHGTVVKYLNEHGRKDVDRLLFEIAQGLEYLHSRNIVHGDLRGANILIGPEHHACLTDFGLSVFSNASSSMRTSTRAGCIYWMAPELIDPDRFGLAGKFVRTPASDIYAFACVCYELYVGKAPFANLAEPTALLRIVNGGRATRPHPADVTFPDELWDQINSCWVETPSLRPTINEVVEDISRDAESTSVTRPPNLAHNSPDESQSDTQSLFAFPSESEPNPVRMPMGIAHGHVPMGTHGHVLQDRSIHPAGWVYPVG
ncbi:Kinase-like protein [Mycena indigotica]|uniref:Kinase-like protein n=1 Tax=Mycena indigotica TaxID=2126181 RepID=A0A8H6TI34_9AGAR|nr:Kinase-like protein [Mycena indigotica]KAF7316135.1 Kinase-like protein [Mycena indigotica]